MDKPRTRYAKCGQISIAYQVFGDGPLDLVYIPGWVSNIDYMWEDPDLANMLKGLSRFCVTGAKSRALRWRRVVG